MALVGWSSIIFGCKWEIDQYTTGIPKLRKKVVWQKFSREK